MQRSTLPQKSGSKSAPGRFLSQIPDGKSPPGGTVTKAKRQNELPELERLISVFLARIASVPADRIGAEIAALLQQVLESCRFDCCGLMRLTSDKIAARAVHAAHREGIAAAPDIFTSRFSDIPWTGENLLKGNIVCFSDLTDLPPQAAQDLRHYKATGTRSSLAIPIYASGSVEYFIVVHHARTRLFWSKETISQMRLIGEICVNALVHCRHNREMHARLRFEQLISDLSVKFVNVAAGEVEREIIAALEQVRELFQFDRFGMITVSTDDCERIVTRFSYGKGIAPIPEKAAIGTQFPWEKKKLLRGEAIFFATLDDLPEEAADDRKRWQSLGIKSHFCVPICVGGSDEYFVVASHVRATHPIDKDLFPRIRMLGEIFVSALSRCKAEAAQREACEEIKRLSEKLRLDVEYLESELTCSHRHEELIGQSNALLSTLKLAEQVAPTDSTVLVCGETGTGKELVAAAIHKLSPRRNKHMVKVNCASLPAALVESELFGREKGAYTGALTRQAGRFELADGGTIFLDEIAETSLELQSKLLRVLQEGQFERLGSTKTIKVDVRVIAATNRNLAEEIKKGRFREDLYYRLNVFQIVIPPLRERIEDIPLLVWSFVEKFGEKMGKKINKISKEQMTALQRYPWPGNVRELLNVVEHAVIVSSGDRLQVRLPEDKPEQEPGMLTLEEYEIRHIKEALRLTGWRIKGDGGAAQLLGLNPSTLYSRMQKLGIGNRQA